MKKTVIFLLLLVPLFCLSQFAQATNGMDYTLSEPVGITQHDASPWSFGTGLTELVSVPFDVSPVEGMYIANYGGKRTENTRRLGKNIFVNYQPSKNVSFEAGYTGGDPGSWSEMNATMVIYDYMTGLPHNVPVSIKNRATYSAWQVSVIGETTGESVRFFGRIGSIHSKVESEKQITYACLPACTGYQGESSSVSQVTLDYGLGLKVKVLNRDAGAGDVWGRLEVRRLPSGKLVSVADFQFPF